MSLKTPHHQVPADERVSLESSPPAPSWAGPEAAASTTPAGSGSAESGPPAAPQALLALCCPRRLEEVLDELEEEEELLLELLCEPSSSALWLGLPAAAADSASLSWIGWGWRFWRRAWPARARPRGAGGICSASTPPSARTLNPPRLQTRGRRCCPSLRLSYQWSDLKCCTWPLCFSAVRRARRYAPDTRDP